jgi:hypothetical protein
MHSRLLRSSLPIKENYVGAALLFLPIRLVFSFKVESVVCFICLAIVSLNDNGEMEHLFFHPFTESLSFTVRLENCSLKVNMVAHYFKFPLQRTQQKGLSVEMLGGGPQISFYF